MNKTTNSIIHDHWRYVPGSEKHQVHFSGKIRRIYLSGKTRELKPYVRAGKWLHVHVTIDGVVKERAVHKLVAEVFEIQGSGDIIMHIGSKHDNSINNLRRVTCEELGKLTGGDSRRKPVIRTGKGEGATFYKSARETGRMNFCSYQTVNDSCNRKTKSNCTGYQFSWT